MAVDPKIIDKIRKLLELSDPTRGASIHEAANAAARAQELMFKHKVSMAEIQAKDVSPVGIEEYRLESQDGGRIADWQASLLHELSRVNGCQCFHDMVTRSHAILIGEELACQTVRYMYTYLESEIGRVLKKTVDEHEKRKAEEKKRQEEVKKRREAGEPEEPERRTFRFNLSAFGGTFTLGSVFVDQWDSMFGCRPQPVVKPEDPKWVADFCLGAVMSIAERLQRQRREDEWAAKDTARRRGNSTTALTVFQREEERINEYVKQRFGGRPRKEEEIGGDADHGAIRAGIDAASSISLRRPPTGSSGSHLSS